MKNLILFAIIAFTLTSCGHFPDGGSVWQQGLWLLPIITSLGALIFLYRGWQVHQSGTKIQKPKGAGGGFEYDPNNKTPLLQIGFILFGLALIVATIVIIIMVNSDK